MNLLILSLMLAQTRITFTPSEQTGLKATVWNVTACGGAAGAASTIPTGRLFSYLAMHGAHPLTFTQAASLFRSRRTESIPARLLEYSGWIATAASYMMTLDVVAANKNVRIGVSGAAGFLGVLVPLTRKSVPEPLDIERDMLGAYLQVGAGSCAGGFLLGGPEVYFQVVE